VKPEAYKVQNEVVRPQASQLPGPVLSYDGDNQWVLQDDYRYDMDGTSITVPKGFRFDLSSVPRPFWSLIAPFELSVTAPLLHDFLYRCGGKPEPGVVQPPRTFTRRQVDDLFRQVMVQEGVAPWRRTLAYAAVRTFGYPAWRKDAKETGRQP
jgi:Protein of unknown function (DUF1353)